MRGRRLLIVAPIALVIGVAVAVAYWTSTGSSTASASVGTLNAPTNVSASAAAGSGTVRITWTASAPAGGLSPAGYYVLRRAGGGGTAAACGSSASSLQTGTSCDDTAVADGSYTYTVVAKYASWTATSAASASVTVVNDNTPPAVTLTAPANNSATNDTTPALGGAAGNAIGDLATVTVKLYSGTGTGGPLLQTIAVTRSGAAWSTDAAVLGEGTYTVQATQTDSAGNTGTSSANTFRVDTTAPGVTLTNPADGSATNSATPAINGTAGNATGDSTTVTVKVYSGASASGSPLQTLTATRSGTAWTTNATTLAQGTYTVQATQTDSAGNAGTSSANTFLVDTTGPAVTLTSPADGSATNSQTPTISGAAGNATGDSTTVTVKVYSGSGATGSPLQTLTATRSGASWSASPTTLAQGTYTVQATQTDSAGNTGTSSANTFTVDTTAPAVTVTAPAHGATTSTATPALAGAAGNATGDSSSVTVRIYNGTGTSGTINQTLTVTRSNASWSTTATALAGGTYTVQATQTDSAGNTGTSNANTFVVDGGAPALTSLQMFDVNANGKVDQVKATFNETLAGSSATAPWTLTNVPSGGTLGAVSTSGAVATLTIAEGSGAADTAVGTFKVALSASPGGIRDSAGNQSSFAATAPADVAAPALTTLQMFDVSANGKVDQVKAAFSETLAGSSATAPWTLTNVPSGGTLGAVSTSGAVATLTVDEIAANAADTAVGTFKVALAASAAVSDTPGNQSSFAATAPSDLAGPVLITATSTPGSIQNRMQSGDSFALTFSEALASVPSSVTITESRSGGTSTLAVPNLILPATIDNKYLQNNNTSGAAPSTSVAVTNSSKTVTVTLGALAETGGSVAQGQGGAPIVPATSLTDAAGNAARSTAATLSPLF